MEIFISAGEASGDLHGSHLARAIWSIAPQTRISCLGGPHMQAEGVSVIVDNRSLSVVGATEVAAHIRAIYGAWVKIRSRHSRNPPGAGRTDRFSRFQSVFCEVCQKSRRQSLILYQPPDLGLAGRPRKHDQKARGRGSGYPAVRERLLCLSRCGRRSRRPPADGHNGRLTG